jgi:hypothetical protein
MNAGTGVQSANPVATISRGPSGLILQAPEFDIPGYPLAGPWNTQAPGMNLGAVPPPSNEPLAGLLWNLRVHRLLLVYYGQPGFRLLPGIPGLVFFPVEVPCYGPPGWAHPAINHQPPATLLSNECTLRDAAVRAWAAGFPDDVRPLEHLAKRKPTSRKRSQILTDARLWIQRGPWLIDPAGKPSLESSGQRIRTFAQTVHSLARFISHLQDPSLDPSWTRGHQMPTAWEHLARVNLAIGTCVAMMHHPVPMSVNSVDPLIVFGRPIDVQLTTTQTRLLRSLREPLEGLSRTDLEKVQRDARQTLKRIRAKHPLLPAAIRPAGAQRRPYRLYPDWGV